LKDLQYSLDVSTAQHRGGRRSGELDPGKEGSLRAMNSQLTSTVYETTAVTRQKKDTTAAQRAFSVARGSTGTLTFVWLWLFIFVYWSLPGTWIPGAGRIPFAKISGALALFGFFQWLLLGQKRNGAFPREMLYLILLFFQLCLSVPFSDWRGGSFDVVIYGFAKVVPVCLLIALAVRSLRQLRFLVLTQAATIAGVSILAKLGYVGSINAAFGERLIGTLGRNFGNPNDFAFVIAMTVPVALAFLLETRNPFKRMAWAVAIGIMIYVVLETFSRGGFIALVAGLGATVWALVIRSRRNQWVLLLVVAMFILIAVWSPAGYTNRLVTIFHPEEDVTGAAFARRDLLEAGMRVTLRNPLLGVGAGSFPFHSDWHGTHNSYLQLSSEAGLPALFFFLLMLGCSFRNLRRTTEMTSGCRELEMMTGGLLGSLIALAAGAFFSDSAYEYYPYLLVGFASALYQIAAAKAESKPPARESPSPQGRSVDGPLR